MNRYSDLPITELEAFVANEAFVSPSKLQRHFNVSYPRAARMLDYLVETERTKP
jgi:hypothetical protein